MKKQGEKHVVYGGCGMLVTVVGPDGAYSFPRPCKMWKCPKCREKKIAHYIFKISDQFLDLPSVHIFVGYRMEKGKVLSNFTNQNCSGRYCRINGIDTSVIISDRKFDGAERYDKKKFLDKNLPVIMNQAWEKGKRVSFSKEWVETLAEAEERKEEEKRLNNGITEEDSGYWAMVVGNVCTEFYQLQTDKEKKDWLNKQQIYQVYPAGKKFLG